MAALTRSARDVVLDVVYDGDDLADVAAAAGLPVEDVIALPLGGDVPLRLLWVRSRVRLSVRARSPACTCRAGRRRARRCPAGSVAIAGPTRRRTRRRRREGGTARRTRMPCCGTSTPTPGADHSRHDRPLRPGRADLCSRRSPARMRGTIPPRSGAAVLRVVSAGVATSLQDQGRPGYAHLAVPRSGAVDRRSADLVNRLVGNPPDAAVLETAGGLVLEAIGAGRRRRLDDRRRADV